MYELSNGENIFYPRWPLKVKGQGRTPENFKVEYLENGTRWRENVNRG